MSLDGTQVAGQWTHSGEWECMECGHIEAGVETQRPEACPDCGAPGEALELFTYGDEGDLAERNDETTDGISA